MNRKSTVIGQIFKQSNLLAIVYSEIFIKMLKKHFLFTLLNYGVFIDKHLEKDNLLKFL